MSTLCNACGINYRRARKYETGLDLDKLSKEVGPNRPSILKSIKRVRKCKRPTAKVLQVPRETGTHRGHNSDWMNKVLCIDTVRETAPAIAVATPRRVWPSIANLLCE